MFSAQTDYIAEGNYEWAVDKTSAKKGSALPLSADYYRDAFKVYL